MTKLFVFVFAVGPLLGVGLALAMLAAIEHFPLPTL